MFAAYKHICIAPLRYLAREILACSLEDELLLTLDDSPHMNSNSSSKDNRIAQNDQYLNDMIGSNDYIKVEKLMPIGTEQTVLSGSSCEGNTRPDIGNIGCSSPLRTALTLESDKKTVLDQMYKKLSEGVRSPDPIYT